MKTSAHVWTSALLSLLLFIRPTRPVGSDQLTVAAAADLEFAIGDLAHRFERQSGQRIRLVIGSSGNLTSEIEQGAPFDLFFSADVDHPERLVREGLAEPGSLVRYAIGRLVVYVPEGSPLDFAGHGLVALEDPAVRKIAIANPGFAPYGRAAIAALRHFGLYDKLAPELVLGEDVSQATQFVESGNAQAGLTALALMLAPSGKPPGRYWIVPVDAYPPLEQAAVIVRGSTHKKLARAFLDDVETPGASAVLGRYGFVQPTGERQ
jgi:molybdate transport system substrate-binding protein